MNRPTLAVLLLSLATEPVNAANTQTPITTSDPTTQSLQTVEVIDVMDTPWISMFEAYGVLRAKTMVQANATGNGGSVQHILVQEGDLVVAGQPLLQLDSTDANFALRQAQNTLDSARTELREQENLLARAQALGDNTTQATLDTRTFAVDKARAAVERAGLVLLQAEENLRRTVVRSPTDGRVVSIDARIGATVGGTTPLVTIAQDDLWVWEGGLPIRVANALTRGMAVVVQAGDQMWNGSVARVLPRANTDGLAQVVVNIQTKANRPPLEGSTAHATFKVEQGRGITLPAEALIYRNGLPWVATMEQNGTIIFQPITVRDISGENLLVDGLVTGTRIVARGAEFLSEGQHVVEAQTTTPNAAHTNDSTPPKDTHKTTSPNSTMNKTKDKAFAP